MELLERDEALQAFEDALQEAAAGRGRALLVQGEAGIGKTALVRSALETHASGARVLLSGCDDLATARPLGPFRDLAAQVDEALSDLLRAGAPVDDLFEPLLVELQRPPRPVVLAVEDVHWADEATLDLLAFVLRRLQPLPALVVLTYRDALSPTHPLRPLLGRVAAPTAVRLDLAPLSREAVARLGGPDDADELWHRTHGIPFLVTALLRHEGDTAVPPSVQDAVLGELADLTHPERSLVELAAVVPSRVETAVLDACAPDWEEHGVHPEQRGLLTYRDGALAFRHELARQAVYEALPASRRRQLHREVLTALRELGADPARLVHHAVGGDDVETLLAAGAEAARVAARAGAHRQALQHYARLIPHGDRLPAEAQGHLWDEYGSELLTAAQPTPAQEAFRRAGELFEQAGDVRRQGRALSFQAGIAQVRHRIDEGDRLEAQAIALLESVAPSPELAHAYNRRAGRYMTHWQFDVGEEWARRAIALAAELGDEKEVAFARIMLGATLVTRGDVEAGLAELEHSIATSQRLRAHNLLALAHANAAEALLDVARPDLAAPYVERGRVLADRHETAGVGGYLTGVHARLLAVRGDWDAAVELARTTWGGGPIDAVNDLASALAMARALLRRGDEVDGILAQLGEIGRIRRELQYHGPATALRAEAAWLVDGPPPDDLLEVLDGARASGQPWLVGDLATWAWRHGLLLEVLDDLPEPYARTVAGDPTGASAAWQARGYPYEAQLALVDSDDVGVVRGAVEAADGLRAAPLATRLRRRLRELGVQRVPRGPQPTTRDNPAGLTDRQLEVLRHVAAGRTNAQIADALVLSVRTVDRHVSATLAKLGVASRHDAAELAAELGIVPAG